MRAVHERLREALRVTRSALREGRSGAPAHPRPAVVLPRVLHRTQRTPRGRGPHAVPRDRGRVPGTAGDVAAAGTGPLDDLAPDQRAAGLGGQGGPAGRARATPRPDRGDHGESLPLRGPPVVAGARDTHAGPGPLRGSGPAATSRPEALVPGLEPDVPAHRRFLRTTRVREGEHQDHDQRRSDHTATADPTCASAHRGRGGRPPGKHKDPAKGPPGPEQGLEAPSRVFPVELWGFEPQTSSMPWRRATNCAIAPGVPGGSPARPGSTVPDIGGALANCSRVSWRSLSVNILMW